MTKVTNPVFSFAAWGTVAEFLEFQRRKKDTIARAHSIPYQPQTDSQVYHRYLFKNVIRYWRTLTAAEQLQWRKDASRYRMTGYQLFMRVELMKLPHVVFYLPMTEGRGNHTHDFSPHKLIDSMYGSTWVPGKRTYAISHDGVDDFDIIYHKPCLNMSAWTLEFWFQPQLYAFTGDIHNKATLFRTQYSYGQLLHYTQSTLGNLVGRSTPAGLCLADTWYWLCLKFKGVCNYSNFEIYVNNVRKDNTNYGTQDGAPSATNSVDLWWFRSGGAYLKGIYDEVFCWNYALTDQERTMHYNAALLP